MHSATLVQFHCFPINWINNPSALPQSSHSLSPSVLILPQMSPSSVPFNRSSATAHQLQLFLLQVWGWCLVLPPPTSSATGNSEYPHWRRRIYRQGGWLLAGKGKSPTSPTHPRSLLRKLESQQGKRRQSWSFWWKAWEVKQVWMERNTMEQRRRRAEGSWHRRNSHPSIYSSQWQNHLLLYLRSSDR